MNFKLNFVTIGSPTLEKGPFSRGEKLLEPGEYSLANPLLVTHLSRIRKKSPWLGVSPGYVCPLPLSLLFSLYYSTGILAIGSPGKVSSLHRKKTPMVPGDLWIGV